MTTAGGQPVWPIAMPVRASALFAVALAGAVVGAAACGGNDSGSDAYGESGAISVTDESVIVEMKDLSFEPQGIRVKPGTTVTWLNNDPVIHNVRQVNSAFLSPDVIPGEAFTFTFTLSEPGRYRYQCTYHHPNMNGVVIVQEDQ